MSKTEKNIKRWIIFFMIVLALSGFTAIPVETELNFLCRLIPTGSMVGDWLDKVYMGFHDTDARYPFLAYGYDWLAFAHFVLAILFIGPLKDPVKNKWVIEFGMIACLLIIPLALIAGYSRGIPFWWQLIDCSFGIIGIVPLGICLRMIHQLEAEYLNNKNEDYNL
jgi:hypothetical protein